MSEEKAAEVVAEHGPTYTDRANDPTTTFYCRPCSEAAGDWVTWTPAHVAKALSDAGLLADGEAQKADKRWNTAVDWLLNEVDANDFAAPFWAYCDGLITERELRSGSVSIDLMNRRRERAEARVRGEES